MKQLTQFTMTLAFLAALAGSASADPAAPAAVPNAAAPGDKVPWQTLSSAGGAASSGSYKLFSVTGEPSPVGEASNSSYKVRDGFLQNFPSSCCNLPGDANNDGTVNVGDAVRIITFIFKGGAEPPCHQEGDPNGDSAINVGDAVRLINFIFKSGTPPVCGP
jgi:hypothetical protein